MEILKKKQLKCYLYTRVSTSMQVDGYSLDAQRDKLRKYAAYEDMIVAGEYSDEGFSGKNIQGRQEFQRMLNDIQDGKDDVSYVLVFKLSRFGRNAADVLNSLQLMQDFGVNLICVEDGIDSSKDAGKLMISVLSAVAEIERENIRTQTMAGREQKAREGKWNGGFAPYGYKLENGNLVIAEDEVEVIRVIYDRYIHTNEGVAGVAKYLNRNGYTKKLRQNNTIPGFSRDFVKNVLYNPVYMGKIAYGRRRTEKKQGTRNEMHVVEQSEFPVYEGQHEAIISEEDWYLAQEKRKINSFKREKVNNPDHAHILSGILKCPCCGKSMYGNIAKAHSKDKKTRYYYYCKNTVTPTGHECSFRLNIEQTEINKFVAKIISAMVNNPRFVEAIQAKIGTAVDTEDMEKQIAVLQGQLKQAFGTKSRLERQMDTLDINDVHYDRKILDLQRRYDEQYDTIEEIEAQIGELQSQIRNIQQEKISGDNIYRLLLAFDEVYHSATEAEQKEFMKAFIERIEMFPEKRKDGSWIKKIVFNFPVPVDGEEVKELPLETETTVDTVAWLYMPGAEVDDPVVQAKDNAYYLQKDENGNYSEWGCYYAHCDNRLSSRSKLDRNTVIFGHSASNCDPDGPKLTKLHRYMDADYVKENPYVYLSVKGEDMVFQITACFITDIDFDYIDSDPTGEELTNFFEQVAKKNWLEFDGVTFGEEDTVLTLSTCCRKYDEYNTGNQRLVLMAKLLPEGAIAQDFTVRLAPEPEMP